MPAQMSVRIHMSILMHVHTSTYMIHMCTGTPIHMSMHMSLHMFLHSLCTCLHACLHPWPMATVYTCPYAYAYIYAYAQGQYTCLYTSACTCLLDRLRACVQHMHAAHMCSAYTRTRMRALKHAWTHARIHTCTHARTHACTHARTHARAGMRCVALVQGRAGAGVEQRQRTVLCGVACQALEQTAAICFCALVIFCRALHLCELGHAVSPTLTFRAGAGF